MLLRHAKITGKWIFAATNLAFIDGTVVSVACLALQENLKATVVDLQSAIESYALLLAACCWSAVRWQTVTGVGASSF